MEKSILNLIGNTPIVELSFFDTGLCKLYLKLENQNPGGSIKDRIGLSMIEAAERDGKISSGSTLIEATAGNTGIGLALVASKKGYRLILVVPDKMSREKVALLRAMGAEIILTRSDVEKGHPEYYQDYAARLAKETPNSYYIDQFNNPANPLTHEISTGPEIWKQMGHDIDALVVGVGSGGTIGGLSRFFHKVKPDLEFILADPSGSILTNFVKENKIGTAGTWLVEGIGEDFVPALSDYSHVKNAYTISDTESFKAARTLLKKEGILAGSSTGTMLAAALRYCREQKTPKKVLTFACDTGNRYLSKMFDDCWMSDQGLMEKQSFGDLRDLISRKYEDHTVITVSPLDSLLTAHSRMRLYDISQLPVIENGIVKGIIDEMDILLSVTNGGPEIFKEKVFQHMTSSLLTVLPATPVNDLIPIFDKGLIPIIKDDSKFYGLITKSDVLNYLRRKSQEQT